MIEVEAKCGYCIDPLVSYKGRYNRSSWEMLKRFGTLSVYLDPYHPVFGNQLQNIEERDIIRSTNDGIEYVVLRVLKTDDGKKNRSLWIQPLFSVMNWRTYNGLINCMALDGVESPFVNTKC